MAASLTPRELGAVLDDRYQLVATVGVGVSARVYLAIDTSLRRRVAVKVLHETLAEDNEFLTRFRSEARSASALDHPNIVKVFTAGEAEVGDVTVPYIVTEYLGGGSLRSMLDTGVRLTPAQALEVGLGAARALAHAHERGLVHRDVKPANLLFDEAGTVRLADFGLARALAEASWTEPADAGFGTTRYASPEQVLGRRLDGRSDVYSLGLVLMEAVTGQVPLLADTAAGTMGLRTHEEVDVPMAFEGLRGPLQRATTLDLEDRAEADELVISLLAASETMRAPAPLTLVPTLGPSELTTELHLGDDLAGIKVLGSAVSLEPEPESADEPAGGLADPVVDEPRWAEPAPPSAGATRRDPIVVAEEHDALVTARPANLGRVEPLDAAVAPAALGGTPQSRARRRVPRGVLVALAVLALAGLGAAWWFLVRVPTHEVADWVGEPVADVQEVAQSNGWILDDATVTRADDTFPGEVVAQSPEPGTTLAEGDTLEVTVSLGPTLVPWPEVVGLPEEDALAALAAAELVVGERTTAFDESVAAGAVVSAAPGDGAEAVDADGMVPKSTPVDMVISDGPAPRTIPGGLVGAELTAAQEALAAVQLTAAVEEAYSDTVAEGVVIEVGTPEGTQVPRDTAVALTVSLGPQPVPIPDVAGQSGSAAAATLEAQGFVVSGIEGSPNGIVLATDPPAGEPHLKGTAVRIFTRR